MADVPLFVAADVGNARIKLGLFEEKEDSPHLPEPLRTLLLGEKGDSPHLCAAPSGPFRQMGAVPFFQFDCIDPWLADVAREAICWRIASVNRPAATRLIDWLREHRPADRVTLLAADDLPLEVRLPRPDMVGIDRLVDAVAVNRLRRPDGPATIVDVGTAITVDLISADGAFLGGAILPGIEMSARALHQSTDLLPLVDTSDLGPPPPAVGAGTVSAIQSGLFWGTIGAIRQLVQRQCETASGDRAEHKAATVGRAPRPQVFLTGGAGAAVAELLGPETRYVPDLTLSGIALSRVIHKGCHG